MLGAVGPDGFESIFHKKSYLMDYGFREAIPNPLNMDFKDIKSILHP